MTGHEPPYLDMATDPRIPLAGRRFPFYSTITPGMTLPENYLPKGVVDQAVFTGGPGKNTQIIGSFDRPEGVVPWSFDYKRAANPNNLPKPYAQRIVFDWKFTLDLVAHIAGNGPYSSTYWPQATVEWRFYGNRDLNPNAATLPWTGKGSSFVQVLPLGTTTWKIIGPYYITPLSPFPLLPFAIPEATQGPVANNVLAQAVYN
jgi:hypothetical protein